MGKVKFYFNVAELLWKVYRGIAALLRKVAVNWSAVDISICLHPSEGQICMFWILTLVAATPRVCATKNALTWISIEPSSRVCGIAHCTWRTFETEHGGKPRISFRPPYHQNRRRGIKFLFASKYFFPQVKCSCVQVKSPQGNVLNLV